MQQKSERDLAEERVELEWIKQDLGLDWDSGVPRLIISIPSLDII